MFRNARAPQATVVTVADDAVGQRLDNFLLKRLKGAPRSLIYRIVRRGEVRINSARARPANRLAAGDRVRIPPLALGTAAPAPTAMGYDWLLQRVLWEDASLLVIDKPVNLAVHGGSGIDHGLIEVLRVLRPRQPFLELAHRLDRETSGCLLLAKSRPALLALHAMLRRDAGPRLTKHYLALVRGEWGGGSRTVRAPLARRSRPTAGKMEVAIDGQPALSHIEPTERFAGCTLVRIRLITGRMHQARVHTAHLGHPIAGDPRYGDDGFNRRLREIGLDRLFLHAELLEFRHPIDGRQVHIRAPLPAALQQVLKRLPTCVATI